MSSFLYFLFFRSNCLQLVDECVVVDDEHKNRPPSSLLCDIVSEIFSTDSSSLDCVDLKQFVVPKKSKATTTEMKMKEFQRTALSKTKQNSKVAPSGGEEHNVANVCLNSKCSRNQICLHNQRCSLSDTHCLPYRCVNSCTVGNSSHNLRVEFAALICYIHRQTWRTQSATRHIRHLTSARCEQSRPSWSCWW